MMKFGIGDGEGILFWHDPWLENKPILWRDEFQALKSRIRKNWLQYSIKDIQIGKCNLFLKSIPEGVRILDLINNLHFSDSADEKEWKVEANGKFVAGKTWELIRPKEAEVAWQKMV